MAGGAIVAFKGVMPKAKSNVFMADNMLSIVKRATNTQRMNKQFVTCRRQGHNRHMTITISKNGENGVPPRASTTVTRAYEAARDGGEETIKLPAIIELDEDKGKRLRIGVYFAAWWGLNVVFNIYNKKVLNAFPFPWLTSALSLAAGSALMAASWATGLVDPPPKECTHDLEFWKALAPVALAHTVGHVAATVSMSKVAVSFTHIIKSAEPALSVVFSRVVMGDHFPSGVYMSLLPIIGGCSLAALTELNFNMVGFAGAMVSNVAFAMRNVFSKKGMNKSIVGGMNYYALLSMTSLALLAPFALAVEGPTAWAMGWEKGVSTVGCARTLLWWMAAQSVFYHLYNQVSYMSLDHISPLTFSVGNTMKRVSVIVSSIIVFRTAVTPLNVIGAATAILGTFLYSHANNSKKQQCK